MISVRLCLSLSRWLPGTQRVIERSTLSSELRGYILHTVCPRDGAISGLSALSLCPCRGPRSRHWADSQGCTAGQSFRFALPAPVWLFLLVYAFSVNLEPARLLSDKKPRLTFSGPCYVDKLHLPRGAFFLPEKEPAGLPGSRAFRMVPGFLVEVLHVSYSIYSQMFCLSC